MLHIMYMYCRVHVDFLMHTTHIMISYKDNYPFRNDDNCDWDDFLNDLDVPLECEVEVQGDDNSSDGSVQISTSNGEEYVQQYNGVR